MSMSTSVVGFKPPDEKWKQMKEIWDACRRAQVEVPDSVDSFFNGEPPDDAGVEVKLLDYPKNHECCKEYKANSESGFEIDIRKLPKDVVIIRFTNSW